MVSLIARLKALGAEVHENEPCINAGGCCVYAAIVGARLRALGVPTWGVVACWGTPWRNLNEIRRNNRPKSYLDWNRAGVYFNHVLIQFAYRGEVWTHDAENTVKGSPEYDPTFDFPVCEGYLTIRELRALAADRHAWNSSFPRDTGIPLIRNAVKKHLTAVFCPAI